MTNRYFVPELARTAGPVELPDAEAQHAIRVMRVRTGDPIVLFDGKGFEAPAKITDLGRRHCTCESEHPRFVSRESAFRLRLLLALPKGDRAKEMVQRLTELGVDEVIPITTQRTQREIGSNAFGKLHRMIIESCKQCGRNQLLRLSEPMNFETALSTSGQASARWILHPYQSRPLSEIVSAFIQQMTLPQEVSTADHLSHRPRIDVFIGPEGGFSEGEIEATDHLQVSRVSLGSRILRVETAAAAIAAIVCCSCDPAIQVM